MKKIEISKCEKNLEKQFARIEDICLFNSQKVMDAFRKNKISTRHFSGTTGYGYSDEGRDKLGELFADIFESEKAIVSPLITCGSHAISIALFALLRPGELLLSITSKPYDTLDETIFKSDNNDGSLGDWGVEYSQIELIDGKLNFNLIEETCKNKQPKVVFIQRSRGYTERNALSVDEIEKAIKIIKSVSPNSLVLVDNCYGEFIEKKEPTSVGADLVVGSMIKNPGGGLAPTGAYFAGTNQAIDKVYARMTSPSLKGEVGSYEQGYRLFYQGLFIAPHIVMNAVKGAYLIGEVMENLGYNAFPSKQQNSYDIIKSIRFNTSEELIKFVQLIQKFSPVDSYVLPLPWDMPGYNAPVIMAAGTFVGGASIELSCDSPIKSPYIAYFQGALTYEHAKIVAENLINIFSN